MTSRLRSYRGTILVVLGLAAFGYLRDEWFVAGSGIVIALAASWVSHGSRSGLLYVPPSYSDPVLDDPDAARTAHLGLEEAEIPLGVPSELILKRPASHDKPLPVMTSSDRSGPALHVHPAAIVMATQGIVIFLFAIFLAGISVGDALFLGVLYGLACLFVGNFSGW